MEFFSLRASMRALSAYHALKQEPIMAQTMTLLDSLCAKKGGAALDAYSQLFYTLRCAGYNGARTMEAAAVAGVDSIEHGAYADADALQAMKEAGTVWVPTLSTVGNLRGKGRFDEGAVQKILASALENVAIFAAMGGHLAPGTDAGAWEVPHGSLTEYELLNEALGSELESILARGIGRIQEKF